MLARHFLAVTSNELFFRMHKVLERIIKSLRLLADTAAESNGAVAAISHSTFMRMLLAVAEDKPLAETATYGQKNGCINVLDLCVRGENDLLLEPKSNLFRGSLSRANAHFSLRIPRVNLIRVNEVRHLQGLL